MRVIGVVSGKGGVGKTTIATNLGTYLAANTDKNVMIVDANMTTPHIPLHLGIEYMPTTLNHVIKGHADVRDAIFNHSSGLKVLPASMSMKDMEGVDMFKLSDVVDKVYNKFFGKLDFLLLDVSPGFGREAMAAFRACKEILMVSTPHTPAVMDTIRCKHMSDKMDIKSLGMVLNMVKKGKGELKGQDVELITGTKVLASVPYDKNVGKGLMSGTPITIHKKRSKASKRIGELANTIL